MPFLNNLLWNRKNLYRKKEKKKLDAYTNYVLLKKI